MTEDEYRLLSVAYTVRSVEVEFAEAIRWHLEPFRRLLPEAYGYPVDLYVAEEDRELHPAPYSFFMVNRFRFRAGSLVSMLAHALWDIHSSVPRSLRDFLCLHAGAVARDGRAVLLPAGTGSGKSTLVAALLRAGFGYLSDELGAIDPITSRAYPYQKRINLDPEALQFLPGLEERLDDRRGLTSGLRERFARPEDLGAGVAGASPVGAIVFPTPDFEGPPLLVPLTQAEAVARLAGAAFNLHRYDGRGLILLGRVAKEAQAFELAGGTPAERADLIAGRVG